MKYAKLTRLSARDLQVFRGALREYQDDLLLDYDPQWDRQENEGDTLDRIKRAERLIGKLDQAEIKLEQENT